MKVTELFSRKVFVLTSEVGPIKGCVRETSTSDAPAFLKEAELVKGVVHAVNVTDNQSAVMRLGSLAGSVKLKEKGIEPVYQLTCRDRNRIALQSELLSAYSLGIDHVLALTGDFTTLGDHAGAKPVFDLDSVQLLKIASELKEGRDMEGNVLTQAPDFAVGAVVNPNFDPIDLQLIKMEKKIEAGAQFFQTQPVYEPARFEAFVKRVEGFGVPIQMGFVLVKSSKMARYMTERISGIRVPDGWASELEGLSPERSKEKCVEMSARVLKEVGSMCQGIHFMPMGWSDVVPRLIEAAGLPKIS
ncbi:MAG: methylenetetrahydrofolate reductase [Desulfomonile tiedjei]|uniref:Methylenetetrahydrofolate reductase n=1 Tax=Desulfomonile tiedjei TaxID=2358 RepID=A0A9D6V101_9BACT|nr:methylenetetrahydrofolate reductase [Desulfomonile tiedjei]